MIRNIAAIRGAVEPVESSGPSNSARDIEGENTTRAKSQPKGEDEQKAEDLAMTSDSALYLFYFQSIGLKFGLTAICLAMIPVFLSQFTREPPPADASKYYSGREERDKAVMLVLTSCIEIWLKWWTDSNTESSTPNNGMYYGVYVALSCVYILTIGIDCWCVTSDPSPLTLSSQENEDEVAYS